ncbi:MAG TPA: hypothetical protein VIJ95_00515 [Hanamia sp.]
MPHFKKNKKSFNALNLKSVLWKKVKYLKIFSVVIKYAGWSLLAFGLINPFVSYKNENFVVLITTSVTLILISFILIALDGLSNLGFDIYENTVLFFRVSENTNRDEDVNTKVPDSIKHNLNALHNIIIK